MNTYPLYTHFWDGTDGDGWCEDHQTKEAAMKAHQNAIKSKSTFQSRVIFYPDDDAGELIARWTRGMTT